jgi:hypothetical protein
MKQLIFIILLLMITFNARTQENNSVQKDSLSFIKSKKMSDDDLAKKRRHFYNCNTRLLL